MACVLTDPRSVLALPTDLLRLRTRVHACRYLHENNLTGTIPDGIGSLTALTRLYVLLHSIRTRQSGTRSVCVPVSSRCSFVACEKWAERRQ